MAMELSRAQLRAELEEDIFELREAMEELRVQQA